MENQRLSKQAIRKIATHILREADITAPPVSLNDVVKYLKSKENLNFYARSESLPNTFSGMYTRTNNTVGVLYNKNQPQVRQRFTVAHELGHLVLGHTVGVNQHNELINLSADEPIEVEANIFAAELLMPFDWLKKEPKNGQNVIDELARKYQVSTEAMGWRLTSSDSLLLS